jgi:hypothetical protein
MYNVKLGSPFIPPMKKQHWPYAALLTALFIVIPVLGSLAATYFGGS